MRGILGFSVLCGVFAGGCLSPTQFTLILETDAYCPPEAAADRNVMNEVGITATQEPPTEPVPDNRTTDCSSGGTKLPRTIGTLVLIPSDEVDVPINAKMAMSVAVKSEDRPACITYESASTDKCYGTSTVVENDAIVAAYKKLDASCCDGDDATLCAVSFGCEEGSADGCDPGLDIGLGDAGILELSSCIIARRRMRFVSHTPLESVIGFDTECIGVTCKDDATCIRGECVSSELECNDTNGVCDLVNLPEGGSGGTGATGGTGGRGGSGGTGGTGGFGPTCDPGVIACENGMPTNCPPCAGNGIEFCDGTGCCDCTPPTSCMSPVCQTCAGGTACAEPQCDACECEMGACNAYCQGMSFAGGSCMGGSCKCDAPPVCNPIRPPCFQTSNCGQYCSQMFGTTPNCDPSPAANVCCGCVAPGVGGSTSSMGGGGSTSSSMGGGGSTSSSMGGGGSTSSSMGGGGNGPSMGGGGPTTASGAGGGLNCGLCLPPFMCTVMGCCMNSSVGGASTSICM